MVAVQIEQTIKERSEAEEANVRLKVMREDEALFRKTLQEKRHAKYKVTDRELVGVSIHWVACFAQVPSGRVLFRV